MNVCKQSSVWEATEELGRRWYLSPLILQRVSGGLEPLPAVDGCQAGYTLLVHRWAEALVKQSILNQTNNSRSKNLNYEWYFYSVSSDISQSPKVLDRIKSKL